MDNWNKLSDWVKFNILAQESTVDHGLLIECNAVKLAVKNGKSKADCLKIINENF